MDISYSCSYSDSYSLSSHQWSILRLSKFVQRREWLAVWHGLCPLCSTLYALQEQADTSDFSIFHCHSLPVSPPLTVLVATVLGVSFTPTPAPLATHPPALKRARQSRHQQLRLRSRRSGRRRSRRVMRPPQVNNIVICFTIWIIILSLPRSIICGCISSLPLCSVPPSPCLILGLPRSISCSCLLSLPRRIICSCLFSLPLCSLPRGCFLILSLPCSIICSCLLSLPGSRCLILSLPCSIICSCLLSLPGSRCLILSFPRRIICSCLFSLPRCRCPILSLPRGIICTCLLRRPLCSCLIFLHCRIRRLRIIILLLFIYRSSFGKLFCSRTNQIQQVWSRHNLHKRAIALDLASIHGNSLSI